MNSSKSQKWTNTQGRTKSEGVCLITTRSEESSIVSGGYELARLIYVASEPKIAGHSWTVVFGRGFIVDRGEHCQIPLWLTCSKHKLRPEPTEDWKSEVSPRFPIAVAHPHSGGSALSSTREEQASPEFWRPRRSIRGFRFGRRTLDKGRGEAQLEGEGEGRLDAKGEGRLEADGPETYGWGWATGWGTWATPHTSLFCGFFSEDSGFWLFAGCFWTIIIVSLSLHSCTIGRRCHLHRCRLLKSVICIFCFAFSGRRCWNQIPPAGMKLSNKSITLLITNQFMCENGTQAVR